MKFNELRGYGVNGFSTDKRMFGLSSFAYPLPHSLTPYPGRRSTNILVRITLLGCSG